MIIILPPPQRNWQIVCTLNPSAGRYLMRFRCASVFAPEKTRGWTDLMAACSKFTLSISERWLAGRRCRSRFLKGQELGWSRKSRNPNCDFWETTSSKTRNVPSELEDPRIWSKFAGNGAKWAKFQIVVDQQWNPFLMTVGRRQRVWKVSRKSTSNTTQVHGRVYLYCGHVIWSFSVLCTVQLTQTTPPPPPKKTTTKNLNSVQQHDNGMSAEGANVGRKWHIHKDKVCVLL